MERESTKPAIGRIGAIQPRKVSASQPIVREFVMEPGYGYPLVIEAAIANADLLSWANASRGYLDEKLAVYGAILFRGFGVRTPADFEAFIQAVSGDALEYRERSSPRNSVAGNIYTSTEHPPDQPIFFHNENSYAGTWPLKIFFYCQTAAAQGGETPISDVRRAYRRVPQQVRSKFEEKGVMYIRNFSNHIGLSWPTVFQTEDRGAVEQYCHQAGYRFEWLGDDQLRTRRVAPAVAHHPRTAEPVWFNHAAFFHVSTLVPAVRDALRAQFADDELPNQTCYGDGSPFEDETVEILRQAYAAESMIFPWQAGDILFLDNMLTAHARAPFAGPRKVLVGMSEPCSQHASKKE